MYYPPTEPELAAMRAAIEAHPYGTPMPDTVWREARAFYLGGGDVHEIARCPIHGLHGDRRECFECGGPVERVPMVEVSCAGRGLRD